MGVTLYQMLFGILPFGYGKGKDKDLILQGEFAFPENSNVSEEAKDLVRKLLTVNPDIRIGVSSIHKHPWLSQAYLQKPAKQPATNKREQRSKNFKRTNKFQSPSDKFFQNVRLSSAKRGAFLANKRGVGHCGPTSFSPLT